ncbi:TonB-dependent receptor [Chitinophaga silvatica]|uniref:TonB-dependent receptor n=1 Tax=Chitinophaga silvatica TaxID=2282649 RepID=A0A3E1Y8M7_9BACT|nr:TonB-dependent receptor [Chitinophaga silvatica]RFS21329.1 TonB-dependent receptor [Chitinophaga silvatica]
MRKTLNRLKPVCCFFICYSLLMISSSLTVFSQSRTVKGVITSEAHPLPGATVLVKGTKTVALSNLQGEFSINAAKGDVLVITYLSYQTKEVVVGDEAVIRIALVSSASKLDELVVVAYGKSKRANLTGAQTTVTSKEMDRTVNTTLEQAIQGRAAGVYITQNSGQPGGGISLNIRGINSINGTNEPLYVIDGVQIPGSVVSFGSTSSSNPLAGLNPADIDNIEVLQGPSATALFGSRATNGVLMITTKRGKAGDSKLDYSFQYNVQAPPPRIAVMDLRQYAQMVNEYHQIAGGNTQGEFKDPSLLGKGTDWQKELFRNAPMSKHQLSLSGGTDKTTFYLSGEYLKQSGIALGSGFDRYGFRLNLDNKPRNWVTLNANLSFNQINENLTTSQENIISTAITLTPQIPVKNLDGTWGGGDLTNGANIYTPVNPIAIANLNINRSIRRQLLGGIGASINPLKDLYIKTNFNTNVGFSNTENFLPTYSIGWAVNDQASLTNLNGTNTYWNLNQLIEYTKSIGKHNINLMVGHESQYSNWKNLTAGRKGFLTNDILDLNAGNAANATNGGGQGEWAMESFFGRLNYNYEDRYILSTSIRRDGSANFGDENIWGYFPAVSAAWRISKEKFFNVSFISDLKLRFETGTTGNSGGGGAIYSPMQAAATPTGTGFLPARYSNPTLQWESTQTNNIGINVGLLENRISLEVDYYKKRTTNLLMEALLPWYMGTNGTGSVAAPTVNAGTLENKGWAFTINTTNIKTKEFKWESSLNLSGFKAKSIAFNSESGMFSRTSWWLDNWTQRSVIGQAPWLFMGYKEDGIFQSVEEINNSPVPVDNTGKRFPTNVDNIWVGDVKYKDISGPDGKPDGIIDVNDLTFIGNPWPKVFGGLTNNFSYKGFDISILITGTYGNDVYNYLARVNSNPNQINISRNMMVKAMEYAKPVSEDGKVYLSNPGTNVPRISNGPNNNYVRITDKYVEDGSFLRLKNISLSYSLPASLIGHQKIIKGARFTFGVQNLLTLTGYSGYDPEVGAYVGRDASSTNQAIGLDYGRYPLTRIYTFALNVNF